MLYNCKDELVSIVFSQTSNECFYQSPLTFLHITFIMCIFQIIFTVCEVTSHACTQSYAKKKRKDELTNTRISFSDYFQLQEQTIFDNTVFTYWYAWINKRLSNSYTSRQECNAANTYLQQKSYE